ncbi:MAG: uncharacterized protein KVP18_001903 [Porospora cf. gigantea A]|uniref:uncharacterized protein n=1 Tax=Porospora cf. gigantea A TaxID=2853593 RepID=UPI003559D675|nr:MAG: hypothetical protein KVP18_001903 [Porospora cf. gigantea A]
MWLNVWVLLLTVSLSADCEQRGCKKFHRSGSADFDTVTAQVTYCSECKGRPTVEVPSKVTQHYKEILRMTSPLVWDDDRQAHILSPNTFDNKAGLSLLDLCASEQTNNGMVLTELRMIAEVKGKAKSTVPVMNPLFFDETMSPAAAHSVATIQWNRIRRVAGDLTPGKLIESVVGRLGTHQHTTKVSDNSPKTGFDVIFRPKHPVRRPHSAAYLFGPGMSRAPFIFSCPNRLLSCSSDSHEAVLVFLCRAAGVTDDMVSKPPVEQPKRQRKSSRRRSTRRILLPNNEAVAVASTWEKDEFEAMLKTLAHSLGVGSPQYRWTLTHLLRRAQNYLLAQMRDTNDGKMCSIRLYQQLTTVLGQADDTLQVVDTIIQQK